MQEKELIVLVHGFGSQRLVMWPFACLLRARGFRVVQWGYLSYFAPIETHASRFFEFLRLLNESERRFHIVAHSMGSIVTQAALNRGAFTSLQRIVFLAPPNRGTGVTRRVPKLLKRIFVPLVELSNDSNSYVNQLVRNSLNEIGIIAARYDVLVSIQSTHLPCERSHVVLRATHNSLLISSSASRLTARFLQSGDFLEPRVGAGTR